MWRKVVHLGVQANRVLGQLLGAHIGFLRSLTATLSVHPVVPLRGLLDNATPGIWNLPWTSLTRVSTPSISDRCQCPPLCCCKKWRGGSFESQPHATRIRFPMPKAFLGRPPPRSTPNEPVPCVWWRRSLVGAGSQAAYFPCRALLGMDTGQELAG